MPLISIIVPVYKVEPFLRRCVDSILNQTCTVFELILVDDGSPDGCPAICDAYARQDSRVRVIHQKNSGLAAARNSGMAIAAGKYILFCDSDDYVSPDWCALLLAQVRESHDNYIFGQITVTPEKTAPAPGFAKADAPVQEYAMVDFLSLHAQSKAGFAWNVLYYADVLNQLKLRFRKDVIIEDLPFCLSYLSHMCSLTYCSGAEYFYVQREETTLSRKYYPDGFTKWQEKYRLLLDFLRENLQKAEQPAAERQMADFYLYFFLQALSNTFDARNPLSFWQKLRYNQRVVETAEFGHCMQHCCGAGENPHYLALLKKQNYYIVYLYNVLVKIKRLGRKKIEKKE